MFLQKRVVESIFINGIGELNYQDGFWNGVAEIESQSVVLSFDDHCSQPDIYAIEYYRSILPQLESIWQQTKDFVISQLDPKGHWTPEETEFLCNSVCIHKPFSFEGSHFSIWFDIQQDKQFTYFVTFDNNKPVRLHKDG
ncbi:hypothetical protein [Pleionea sp. CnH1-48]|uniref:hypothetical protein n=1 Tax=Pleionea sp. CnH1-48 TaxID=2954494 RepID=UPI00209826BF|nr:hypothetical protein [Pleionea sp. CnH1-48]MCO7223182.1 hypothetical protein [Pleionea sp. CnH1-48]